MGQSDDYDFYVSPSRGAKDYAFSGRKGEKRAFSKAYADSKVDEGLKKSPWTGGDYMKDVAEGGREYDAKRMSDDADEQERKYASKRKPLAQRKPLGSSKKSTKKSTRKPLARKR